jgi:Arc/MetJ family transcription regulator
MAKTLIDVDDAALEQASRLLGTRTKKDTVNAALAEVVAIAARRRDLDRLVRGDLAALADPEQRRAAWQR